MVGFSGLLHGLFIYAACLSLRRDPILGVSALALIAAKVIWETSFGAAEFTTDLIGMPVATEMHIYGIVGGFILYAFGWYLSRTFKQSLGAD